MAPTVFTYSDPIIDYLASGIKFSAKCEEDCTFVFKTRIISIDRRAEEILIFLADNQIVQLVGLKSPKDIYNSIIDWFSH